MGRITVPAEQQVSINANSLKWFHLIDQIQRHHDLQLVVRVMLTIAFGALHRRPPKYISKAVKEDDHATLLHWAKLTQEDHAVAMTFFNKVFFRRQVLLHYVTGERLYNAPFHFQQYNGQLLMMLRGEHIDNWFNDHFAVRGPRGYEESLGGIAGLGVKNGKPFYLMRDGNVIHAEDKPSKDTEYVPPSVSYSKRMVNATPTWKPLPPPHEGIYVCASFKEERDVLSRGTTPDECTEVKGQPPGDRVTQNLYHYNPNAGEKKVKYQHVSGFYDGGLTHYLDFEVEYA